MDSKQLQKYINERQNCVKKYENQKAYAIGNNVSILRPWAKPAPDNRKPVPFARRAVAMIKGYMAKPGNIQYQGDYYDNTLKPMFDLNDEELQTANELEDALIHGVCYELHWLEEKQKCFYPIPVEQGIPIYNESLKPKLIGFIRLWDDDEDVDAATYYDETYYQEFKRKKNAKDWDAGEMLPHGYGMVPVNIGFIDRDARNVFDHVLPLIDLYDKLISEDVANEAERYNAALMLMAERIDTVSRDEAGRTMVDRIKELRLIDGLGSDQPVTNKVGFVTRDIPTGFIEYATNQIERLIYEMMMIVNPNDDQFATASGVAQAYKLLGMEYLCAGIEAYFSRFLQNRIKIISGLSSSLGDSVEGMDQVTISFKRNLPHNLAETAETMSKLKGIISDEALLRLLPTSVIPDVQEELDKIDEQKPDMIDTTDPVEPDPVVDDGAE